MVSVFTKIINGEIPSYTIFENEEFIALLDINPNTRGHTLCIPKKEVNKLFDLDEQDYNKLMSFARKIAIALKKAIECDRIGVAVVGLEVPHVHVHLIPITEIKDITFQHKVKLSHEDFIQIVYNIKKYINI